MVINLRDRTLTYTRHPDLTVLVTLLSKHDWTYNYSDDHRAWVKGNKEADEIRRQMDICCGLGLSEEATAAHNRFNPFHE